MELHGLGVFLTSVTRLGIFNRFLRQILFQKQPNAYFMGYFEKHQILIKTTVATFWATTYLLGLILSLKSGCTDLDLECH